MLINKIKFLLMLIILSSATAVFATNPSSPIFSPYVDMTISVHWDANANDLEPMDLVQVSQASGVKNFRLAFITDAGSCSPAWGGQASYSVNANWGLHAIERMRANGINATISFGGANNNDISLACNDTQLLSIYEKVINTYQPQGLDFDIENGTANVEKVMRVLQQVQRTHPDLKISFTIPVMPEGLVAAGEYLVKQAKLNGLNYAVNIMAMDYGPTYTNDMGQYAIQAATNLFVFLKNVYPEKSDANLWGMIEVTPMIGVNDISTEQFTLANADALRQFAQQKNIGALSMWSVLRDNPCADQTASSYCSGNYLQSKSYEFSQRFITRAVYV